MGLLSPWFLAGALACRAAALAAPDAPPEPGEAAVQLAHVLRKAHRRPPSGNAACGYLLLLACRLVLLLLLALAFAKPVWERPPIAIAGSIPKLHYIALDTSLSMRYGDRWERAAEEADAIVDSLGQADQAQILTNGPSVQVLTEPTSDKSALQRGTGWLGADKFAQRFRGCDRSGAQSGG